MDGINFLESANQKPGVQGLPPEPGEGELPCAVLASCKILSRGPSAKAAISLKTCCFVFKRNDFLHHMCAVRIAADSRERIPERCMATWWGTAVSRSGEGGSTTAGGEGTGRKD